MKVRTFHVKSMHEAIRSIKDTLGPDAVILSTKRVRSWDNGFGLLGGSMLEVMAAIEDDAAVPEDAPLLGEDERTRAAVAPAPMVPAEESRFSKSPAGCDGNGERTVAACGSSSFRPFAGESRDTGIRSQQRGKPGRHIPVLPARL
jgi:flagellar biosynthesis protein FlhF